jgi:endogenous inhibitor of DNA gyrase (YacG/DUF329 family)
VRKPAKSASDPAPVPVARDPGKDGTAPGACPICGKPRAALYQPFCSRRCADVDLARWFSGSYSIEGEPVDEDKGSDED